MVVENDDRVDESPAFGWGLARRVPHESSIRDLLVRAAGRDESAPALLGTGSSALAYGALLRGVDALACALREDDVRAGERIALVLPNGRSAAVAFLAAAVAGVACPLNPASRRADFEFAFDDLQARTLLIDSGFDSPAVSVALARGMRVVDIAAPPSPAAVSTPVDGIKPSDVALILHTSGTTAKPKMVPLTHANLCASAANIADWLALTPADRCLNIMPLFHIHGLIGALLSSLAAGASIVCSEGFVGPDFFASLRAFEPTWYTAVPTMHQAILARAESAPAPLRFVRSSSAPLAPATARALATLFAAPVIEAYGMTEAAHQMCSNPLALGTQRYGSVGVAAGPDVAILDEHGALVVSGSVGEVAIRGKNVTAGYLAAPAVNAAAFARDWFRTGDLGRFDADGYLYLEGRIKELINRGGEKISPREIDDVLMSHPAVAQAVAFAIPDARLGEEVGAAVVLKPQTHVDERDLIRFAAEGLAEWKIPRRIAIVAELPKGPTGKLVRNGLATLLNLCPSGPPLALATRATPGTAATPDTPPTSATLIATDMPLPSAAPTIPNMPLPSGARTTPNMPLTSAAPTIPNMPPTSGPSKTPNQPLPLLTTAPVPREATSFEAVLAEIWCDVLKVRAVDTDADFLELGGDSILAGQVIARVRKRCGRELSILAFFDRPTLSAMATAISESPAAA